MFFSPFAFADRHFVNEKIFVNEQIAENDLSIISYLNSDFEIIQITQKSLDVSIYHLHRYDLLEDVFEKHRKEVSTIKNKLSSNCVDLEIKLEDAMLINKTFIKNNLFSK